MVLGRYLIVARVGIWGWHLAWEVQARNPGLSGQGWNQFGPA